MAASLEARVPYLDRRVSELANSLMDAWCVSGKECKPLLKAIAARFVPPSVIYRKKIGFDLPVDNWLRGPFREQIEALIAKRALPMLNYAWIRAAYDLLLAGKNSNVSTLWAWFVYEQWFDHWVKTPVVEPVANRVGAGG
jgi:asparagine synthase (glutamine-hydrolysing)